MASEENGDPFYGSHWDPMVSLSSSMVPQNEFGNANFLENQIMASSSQLVHFPPDSSLVEMLPKIPSFGNGSYSEMVSSFGHIIQSGSHHSSFAKNNAMETQIASNSKHHDQKSEDGVLPNQKRKRNLSVDVSPKNAEEEERQQDTCEIPKDDDEKKRKLDQNVKQTKETSTGAEPSKENYIHVRAKRGQATNSHSLAERVRRERISERMRLLQELVPGCNKITGKAVMLDEIINYVQSLQQQVEFLSMKLATVNPEVNVDIDRLLSKDILHSRGSNGISLGNGLALNSSHPFPGYPQAMFNTSQGTTTPFHPLSQNIWNSNELQSILQMGFDSDHPVSSLGPNGISKMEL